MKSPSISPTARRALRAYLKRYFEKFDSRNLHGLIDITRLKENSAAFAKHEMTADYLRRKEDAKFEEAFAALEC
jgi:hypothetical protein